MTAIELRSEIMQLLRGESNTAVLEAIRMLLRREEAEEEITDEELAELDEQRADRISGKTRFVGEEDSIRMIREGGKG
jgi:hypothetical protein